MEEFHCIPNPLGFYAHNCKQGHLQVNLPLFIMPNEGDAHMLQAVPHFLLVHIRKIEEYF